MKELVRITFFLLFCFQSFSQSDLEKVKVEIDTKENSSYSKSDAYLNQARKAEEKKEYVDALYWQKQALFILDSIKDVEKIASINRSIGDIHFEINDFSTSMNYYLRSLEQYEKLSKFQEISSVKKTIGDLYLRLGQCDQAFLSLFEVQRMIQDDKSLNRDEYPSVLQSIGIAYGTCGSIDSALVYFQKALNHVEKPYAGIFTGGLINNIGAVYSRKDQNEKALSFYNKALVLFKKENIQEGIGVSKGNIAYIYKKQGRYQESIELFKEVLEIFKEEDALVYLRDNYLNLSEVYELAGNDHEALKYNNLYLDLNDSISNSMVLSDMNNLQMQYEIKKKDQEILISQQKADLIASKSKIQRIRLLLIIGGVLLVLVIVFLAYRNKKVSLDNVELNQKILQQEKKELNHQLVARTKELEGFALSIVEKNDLLEQLKTKIKDVSTKDEEGVETLKDITNTINNRLYIEKDKKEFEMQLDEAYQSFFIKLDQKYPNLTKNERRLCSLLALELSSKDIAIILNISSEGVKKSRYRLRKKLGLESDTDLTLFIQSI